MKTIVRSVLLIQLCLFGLLGLSACKQSFKAHDNGAMVKAGGAPLALQLHVEPGNNALNPDKIQYGVPAQSRFKGSITGTAPNLMYTPAPGFEGTDQFTYKAWTRSKSGLVLSDSGTVYISVTARLISGFGDGTQLGDKARRAAAVNNTIYLATDTGLAVIDMTDTTRPTRTFISSNEYAVRDMRLLDNKLYLLGTDKTTDVFDVVRVFDVTQTNADPKITPTLEKEYTPLRTEPTPTGASAPIASAMSTIPPFLFAFDIHNGYLYSASFESQIEGPGLGTYLTILDVNGLPISQVSETYLQVFIPKSVTVRTNVPTNKTYAFISGSSLNSSLLVVDVTDPLAPVLVNEDQFKHILGFKAQSFAGASGENFLLSLSRPMLPLTASYELRLRDVSDSNNLTDVRRSSGTETISNGVSFATFGNLLSGASMKAVVMDDVDSQYTKFHEFSIDTTNISVAEDMTKIATLYGPGIGLGVYGLTLGVAPQQTELLVFASTHGLRFIEIY